MGQPACGTNCRILERVVYVRLSIEESYATSLFSLACCLAAGSLIYRFIDRPFVRGARRMARFFHVRRTAAS
jgi:hypothetical protein